MICKLINLFIMKNNLTLVLKGLLFSTITLLAISCSKDDDPAPAVVTTPKLIADYYFDGTYTNDEGTMPFQSNDFTSFTQNTLVVAAGTGTTATIDEIPTGNQTRTIVIEFKVAANVSTGAGIFSYGTPSAKGTFGMYLGPNGNPVFQGYGAGNDHDFGGDYASGRWRQIIITYDGTTVTLYQNGASLGTFAHDSLNTGNTIFKLGNANVAVTIDNLKIYNYVLSQAQITGLYEDYRS